MFLLDQPRFDTVFCKIPFRFMFEVLVFCYSDILINNVVFSKNY